MPGVVNVKNVVISHVCSAYLAPSLAPDLEMLHAQARDLIQVIVSPGIGEVYDKPHLKQFALMYTVALLSMSAG